MKNWTPARLKKSRNRLKVRQVIGLVTAVGALAIVGIWVPGASATIVAGQGIAGIKLGDSQARVKKVLDTPSYTDPGDETSTPAWGYDGEPFRGRIGFDKKTLHVRGMWTISKKQKTNKGIGPGSSLSKTKKAYPKAKCTTGPFGPRSAICTVKSRYHGKAVTTEFVFFTTNSPMREIDIDYA